MFKWMINLFRMSADEVVMDSAQDHKSVQTYHVQRSHHPQTFKMNESINSKGE